ncbi:MAG: hypothetical protein K0S39_2212, partial [Paenibacillus sp.]|nr:hypothetical protein [Paenibacillus sp.]
MPSLQMNSHSFLRHLFTCTSNGIAVITPNGSWIEINPALSRMLGYSNEELMMLSLRDIVHPEEQWDDLLEDEYESLETVRRLIHKNGSVIWAGIHILKFEEESGENRSRILLQITDKTEIRELERQLIRHENLFELVTQNSRDIIYQCSLDGVLLYCSRSFQELLDYSPDELIGKMEEMLYHPDDLQAFNESRQSLTKTNQFRIRHKAG